MRIAHFNYVLAETISGVSINRDTSSTRGRAGGGPLIPLQYNLVSQGARLIPLTYVRLLSKHLRGVD